MAVIVLLSISASPVYTAAGLLKCWEKMSPGGQLLSDLNFNRSWEYRRMRTPLSVTEKQVVNLLLERHCLQFSFCLLRVQQDLRGPVTTIILQLISNMEIKIEVCIFVHWRSCMMAPISRVVSGRNVCP